jgi:hypothetical protein
MRLPKDFNLLPNYISQDIYKKIGNAIAKEMMDTYRSAIKNFYADYKPRVYRRRHRSYYFVDPSGTRAFTKLIHQKTNGKGFSVEMNITPDNIRVPYTSITGGFSSGSALNQMVFTNTFVYGQHGGRLPWDILPEDERPRYPSDRWKAYKTGWVWEPPRMDTPPKKQIDWWFKGYIKSNKIDRTIDGIVENSIEQFMNSYIKQHMSKGGK